MIRKIWKASNGGEHFRLGFSFYSYFFFRDVWQLANYIFVIRCENKSHIWIISCDENLWTANSHIHIFMHRDFYPCIPQRFQSRSHAYQCERLKVFHRNVRCRLSAWRVLFSVRPVSLLLPVVSRSVGQVQTMEFIRHTNYEPWKSYRDFPRCNKKHFLLSAHKRHRA